MAFVTSETSAVVQSGSTPNTIVIQGTYLSSAGGTGGAIAAGYSNSSGSFTATSASNSTLGAVTIGGRNVISCVFTPTLSDVTVPGGVISYNSALDAYVFTVVTTADTGGQYTLTCANNGA